MRLYVFLLAAALGAPLAYSQPKTVVSYEPPLADIYSRTIELNEKALAFGIAEAEFNTLKDQAYPNPGFLPGVIYHDNKPVKANVPMRYNAYADEIEIKKNANDANYGALVKNPDIYVKVGKNFYVFVPFEDSVEKGGYFNVVYEGEDFQLYKKVTATFKEAQEAKSSYGRRIPPSFATTTTYYVVDKGTFLQLPQGKNNLQHAFVQLDSDLKNYIKDNKLDLNRENDLAKVVQRMDKKE